MVCLEIVSMFIDNKNFGTYKGALYENIVAEMLTKAGFELNKKIILSFCLFMVNLY